MHAGMVLVSSGIWTLLGPFSPAELFLPPELGLPLHVPGSGMGGPDGCFYFHP